MLTGQIPIPGLVHNSKKRMFQEIMLTEAILQLQRPEAIQLLQQEEILAHHQEATLLQHVHQVHPVAILHQAVVQVRHQAVAVPAAEVARQGPHLVPRAVAEEKDRG
jgi:hypothetical protein